MQYILAWLLWGCPSCQLHIIYIHLFNPDISLDIVASHLYMKPSMPLHPVLIFSKAGMELSD